MEQRLAEKVAIVTGAGQGIGKGIALRLAREGADIVIAEYNPQTAGDAVKEVEALGRRALGYPVDISNVDAVKQMVKDVVAEFGHIDILVNNAGVVQTKPMLDLSVAEWDRVINVNQRGMFFCLQAVAAQSPVPPPLRRKGPAGLFLPEGGACRTCVRNNRLEIRENGREKSMGDRPKEDV